MKKTLMMSVLGGLALGLTACASTPTNTIAIQKENNQYEVTGIGKTNLISKNNSVSAAQKTCTKNTSPVVVDEKTNYQGVLKGVVDEQTGKMVEAAAGVIGTLTGKNASLAKDDDYQTTLTFYCKPNA
jgi:predicted lipoprotein with Yx(FWY)xxD motif